MSDRDLTNNRLLPLFISAFAQLSEGVIIADKDGRLVYVNKRAEELHGVKQLDIEPDDYSEVYSLTTMDDAPYPTDELPLTRAVLKGEYVEGALWKIHRPDGSVIVALGTAKPVYDQTNTQIASVLTLSDHTHDYLRQQELESVLAQREAMLLEINHRVKNNLQIVSSLLNIEASRVSEPGTRQTLDDLAHRIDVIADVNRRLYVSGRHNDVDIIEHLNAFIVTSLAKLVELSDAKLALEVHGSAIMSADKAISLSLAINELVLNSIRHAFLETPEPTITISLYADNEEIRVSYRDNGCGLPIGEDLKDTRGFGRVLLAGLESHLNATLTHREENRGYELMIEMPLAPLNTPPV